MAAWNLTRKGINVVLLDAGSKFDRANFWTHVPPWEAREREARGEHAQRFFLDTAKGEGKYLTPTNRPFELIRVWGHGGKTNVWGRVSLRYADLDFKGPARDGWEIPWPIEYKDVAPYYDQVEQLIGVNGGDDDSESLPGSKFLLPPPPPRCGERLLWQAFDKLGLPMVHGRRANMTKPVRGFPACHYCGNCGAGCDTASFFCSADHLLPFALKTGKLEIRSNAVVGRILVNDKGLAEGVQYFDRQTGTEHRVYAKVVVMGASAVDTTRILLNSKSTQYPNGIGNGSDVIGRYLCEQIRVHVSGFLPRLVGNGFQQGSRHWRRAHLHAAASQTSARTCPFICAGTRMQFWNTGCIPGNLPTVGRNVPGFGADLKREIKRHFPAWVELHPFGETLPYADNRITTDESQPDRYGLPMLKIDYRIRENERKMTEHIPTTRSRRSARRPASSWCIFTRGELDSNGIGDPRARLLPHGRGSEAVRVEQVQPDARSEERVRGGWIGVHECQREESDTDDSGALVARVRLPRRGDQTGESLIPSETAPSDCIVVGGGAAGLMAAIMAARGGARVLVLEGASRLGAKILISGGGRCNVTNRIVTAADFWGGSRSTIARVLSAWTVDDTVRFFAEQVCRFTKRRAASFFRTPTRPAWCWMPFSLRRHVRRGHRNRLARGPGSPTTERGLRSLVNGATTNAIASS